MGGRSERKRRGFSQRNYWVSGSESRYGGGGVGGRFCTKEKELRMAKPGKRRWGGERGRALEWRCIGERVERDFKERKSDSGVQKNSAG